MKVLILQPPSPPGMNVKRDLAGGMGVADPSERQRYGHDRKYITMPYLSLLLTAGVLEREGYDVAFVNGQAEDLDLPHLTERVRAEAPQVVIQLLNLPSLYGDLEVLKTLREQVGVKTAVVGTVTIPLFDLIADSGAVDAILRGDPELIAPQVLKVFAGQEDPRFEIRRGVLANKEKAHLTDLDSLPPTPYHLAPLNKYWYYPFGRGIPYASVFASRGCSYRCYYCPYPMGFGEKIVHRGAMSVVDEIESLQKTWGVQAILFRDQVFSENREKVMQLCDKILRRKLKFRWLVETRLDKVDEEMLIKMREAGCVRLQFGMETGDAELFDKVGKDGAKGQLETFIKNFALVEKVGMAAHLFILVGLLGETWKTIHSTIKTVERMKPLTLQVSVVTPYPGTGFYDSVKRKGLLGTEDLSKYSGFISITQTEQLSTADLDKARQMIMDAHRKCVRWKRIARLGELTVRYTKDGTIMPRLRRRFSTWVDDLPMFDHEPA